MTEKKTEVKETTPATEFVVTEGMRGVYVARKILALRTEVTDIESSTMKTKKFSYNYLSEAELTKALRPAMIKLGLVILPTNTNLTTENYDVDGYNVGETKKLFLSEVEVTYVIIDTETGDNLQIRVAGSGADSSDKAANKAITCAFKNALRILGMFPSPDRDDPDTTASPSDTTSTVKKPFNSGGIGSLEIKYGDYAGKTMQQLFDENPEAVEGLAAGKSKWIADKAKEFLATQKTA